MCELFALSSCHPATVTFAFKEFQSHGGEHHRNGDGWGMAFYEGHDARVLRDTGAARDSSFFNFIQGHEHPSKCVISHIRHATMGPVSLCNTQPYVRELDGRLHCFAHNGDVAPEFLEGHRLEYQPIGQTDSELVFCVLMTRLRQSSRAAVDSHPLEIRTSVVREFAREFRPSGTFNFIFSDGEYLFVHSHRRTHEDGVMRPPGLHVLQREDHHHEHGHQQVPGLKIHSEQIIPRILLIASVPLTGENWQPLESGTLAVMRQGELLELHVD